MFPNSQACIAFDVYLLYMTVIKEENMADIFKGPSITCL